MILLTNKDGSGLPATTKKGERDYAFSKIPLEKSGPFGAVDMESYLLNADIGL